jgi:D-glycero-alpha-D-manno-heptose-7-phosphate kinase
VISKTIRSRAPLRISFAGGGSELSPFVEKFGGEVFASAIGLYAYVTVKLINDHKSELTLASQETGTNRIFQNRGESIAPEEVDSNLRLALACFQHLSTDKFIGSHSISISTNADSPIGSGLGTSSVLTVAIVSALAELMDLELSRIEVFQTAYLIERERLKLRGGRQDHALGAFGGFGTFKFGAGDFLEVEHINLNRHEILELESSLLLVYTGQSRESANIVGTQMYAIEENLEGINQKFEVLKTQAKTARELINNLNIKGLGELLADTWAVKKSTSALITNELIDSYYKLAISQGAYGGKLCGAGGGGYLLFVAPPEKVRAIAGQIKGAGVVTHPVELNKPGVEVWLA